MPVLGLDFNSPVKDMITSYGQWKLLGRTRSKYEPEGMITFNQAFSHLWKSKTWLKRSQQLCLIKEGFRNGWGNPGGETLHRTESQLQGARGYAHRSMLWGWKYGKKCLQETMMPKIQFCLWKLLCDLFMGLSKSARHMELGSEGKGCAIHQAHPGRRKKRLQHTMPKELKNPVDTGTWKPRWQLSSLRHFVDISWGLQAKSMK